MFSQPAYYQKRIGAWLTAVNYEQPLEKEVRWKKPRGGLLIAASLLSAAHLRDGRFSKMFAKEQP